MNLRVFPPRQKLKTSFFRNKPGTKKKNCNTRDGRAVVIIVEGLVAAMGATCVVGAGLAVRWFS